MELHKEEIIYIRENSLRELTKMVTKDSPNKKQPRSYSVIKEEIILKNSELRGLVQEAVQALRNEKKERKAITEQLKNDFVNTNIVGKTLIYEVIKESYATEEQLQEIQANKQRELDKRKRAIITNTTGGGQQIVQEGGDGDGEDEDDDDDPASIREKAKKNLLNKNVRKSSSAMQKMAPNVMDDGLNDEDEDDNDNTSMGISQVDDDNDDYIPLREHGNNIVIEDEDHKRELKQILLEGDDPVIVVNKNLVPESVTRNKRSS